MVIIITVMIRIRGGGGKDDEGNYDIDNNEYE